MSRKIVSAFAALILAGSASIASAQERVVNVFNWSDYIDASLLEEFTKETEQDPKQIAEDNWKAFLKLLQAEVGKEVRSQFVLALEE